MPRITSLTSLVTESFPARRTGFQVQKNLIRIRTADHICIEQYQRAGSSLMNAKVVRRQDNLKEKWDSFSTPNPSTTDRFTINIAVDSYEINAIARQTVILEQVA